MSYESTIYPLQDKVMAALDGAGTRFYLTGGTVLSRCYFHHRYSDDLDFFVNDVPFYLGKPRQIPGFPFTAVDNLQNILANKITALRDRTEIKDLVDIREIALQTRPDWKMIFSAADSKSAGIFPPQIAEKMENFDLASLERINWITKPDPLLFTKDIQHIIADILSLP